MRVAYAAGVFGPLLLTACEPTQLYVAHRTVIGVNAGMNSDMTRGRLIVGYDRNFATIVPKSVDAPDGAGKEAMSVLSCSELQVKGIHLEKFVESLATGKAAESFAAKLKGDPGAATKLAAIFDCYRE